MHEGLILVDMKLPKIWKDKEILSSRGNKIQIKLGKSNDTQKLVSFFSTFDDEGVTLLVDEVRGVIKWNMDQEEKNNMLNQKMIELQKMFSENNVDALRKLEFEFKEEKLTFNGEESVVKLASEGDSEGQKEG
tara:strand:+ start:1668 stop:2066 length:399 start_codon:yes stop_codon:yes gene_type:complete